MIPRHPYLIAALVASMAIGTAMYAWGVGTEPLFEAWVFRPSLAFILTMGSFLVLLQMMTGVMEQAVAFMLSSAALQVVFFLIVVLGVLAVIDISLAGLTGIELGIVTRIVDVVATAGAGG